MSLCADCVYIIVSHAQYRDVLSLLSTNKHMSELNRELLWESRIISIYGSLKDKPYLPAIRSYRGLSHTLSKHKIDIYDIYRIDINTENKKREPLYSQILHQTFKLNNFLWYYEDGEISADIYDITFTVFQICREELESDNCNTDFFVLLMHLKLDCNELVQTGLFDHEDDYDDYNLLTHAMCYNRLAILDVMLLDKANSTTLIRTIILLQEQRIDIAIANIVINKSYELAIVNAVTTTLFDEEGIELYKPIIEKLDWPTNLPKKLLSIVEDKYNGGIKFNIKCLIPILRFAKHHRNINAISDCLNSISDISLHKNIKSILATIIRYKSVLQNRCEKIVDSSIRNKCISYLT